MPETPFPPSGVEGEPDDEVARLRRAEDIQRQIDRLLAPDGPPAGGQRPDGPESPRDFIHRRMREGEGGESNDDAGGQAP